MNDLKMPRHLALVTRLCAIFTLIFIFTQAVMADEVVIVNGDRITGKVVRQDAGALKLETAYAGTLEIEWSQVQQLILDEPVKVILNDERVLAKRLFRDYCTQY